MCFHVCVYDVAICIYANHRPSESCIAIKCLSRSLRAIGAASLGRLCWWMLPRVSARSPHALISLFRRYTYGKPVKGEATITAFPDIYSPVLQPVYQSPIRKVVKIEGKATVDFDIVNDLR